MVTKMWNNKHGYKMMHLCKELQLPITGANNALQLDDVVGHIYDKFFKEIVTASQKPEVSADKEEHFRQLLDLNERSNQKPQNIWPTPDDIWIFGYGSLVWKADFPYIDRRRGFITGYQRRFFQHSIDHRGTPIKPGRVVTLLPTGIETDRVYGVAYRIAAQQKGDVLQHLDYREKNGYQRCTLLFKEWPEETGAHFQIIMYIATPDNESYAGQVWQVSRIAEQIFTSAGPSGPNREYLFNLATAMRELFPGVEDQHLFNLEGEVRRRIDSDEEKTLEHALKKEIVAIILDNDDESMQAEELAVEQLDLLRSCCQRMGWKEALLTQELLPQTNSWRYWNGNL